MKLSFRCALLLCVSGASASASSAFAQMSLPSRNVLVTAPGPINPAYMTARNARLTTYFLAIWTEAPFHGLKFAFADPYNAPLQIVSAWAFPSDSYSGLLDYGVTHWDGPNGSVETNVIPTTHSVYQTCTERNGSTVLSCSDPAALPAGSKMYVTGFGIPSNPNGTPATAEVSGSSVILSVAANETATIKLHFANSAAGCPIYFDSRGDDVATVDSIRVATGFTYAGNPASTTVGAQPYTLLWSDYSSCISLSRADGGTLPLVFVYVTLGPPNTVFGGTAGNEANYNPQIAPLLGNRFVFTGIAWNNNADYAGNPGGTAWRSYSSVPILALKYLINEDGDNIVQDGDSLSTAPNNDLISTPIMRACFLISTSQRPCSYINLSWGGQKSNVYLADLVNNIFSLNASAIVGQPISRNDGITPEAFQTLLTDYLSYARQYNVRIGFYGAFPFTYSLDDDPVRQSYVASMRARLEAISTTSQPNLSNLGYPTIPVLDPVPLLTRESLGGNFWDYLGTSFYASAAAPVGELNIPVGWGDYHASMYGPGAYPCLPDDIISDLTTPGAIAPGAQVNSSTSTSVVVPAGAIVGPGVQAGDKLKCAAQGYTGLDLSEDNTHPSDNAAIRLQAAATVFVKALLGRQ